MSQRRQRGDIVHKRAGVGFCVAPGTIRIAAHAVAEPWCPVGCDDPDCQEWTDCEVLDADGRVVGMAYHVSECAMSDGFGSGYGAEE